MTSAAGVGAPEGAAVRRLRARVPADLPAGLLALVFWVVAPTVVLVLAVVGALSLARHATDAPTGIRGTYAVTSHACGRQVCVTGGVFTSADGGVLERDLLGDAGWQLGGTYPALYEPSGTAALALPAKWDAVPTVAGLAGGVLFLGLWSALAGQSLAGARRQRAAGGPAGM